MTLFDLAAKIGLDSSEFEKGIDSAERSGKSLGEKLSSSFDKIKKAAAVALSGVVIKKGIDMVMNLAKATSDAGDKIDKQSQALGLSRKAYQEWDYILGQNGASIDSLSVSMKTLNSLVLDAAAGGKESKTAFSKLGVSIHELETMSMEDQFEAVVRAFQRMPEGAKKSALAVQIFGRNGMELLPLLNQSETSIDELRKRAEELGIIMSDDAVDASVAYNDAMDDLNRTINGLKYSFGAKLLPTLTAGVNKMASYVGKLSDAFQKRGLKGVWDTLVSDFKNIKWPTWTDVKNAAVTAWDTVVYGAKGLAKIVFGENVDGSIKWPTWDDVGSVAEAAWKTVIDGVNGLGKVVFGTNVDGTIKWPTWEEIGTSINTAWKGIVDGVSGLGTSVGKAVFGTNVDGSIKWPTWEEIQGELTTAWNGIVDGVKNLTKAAFGEDVTISPVLQNALSFIQDVGNWVIQNADAVVQGLGAVFGVFALKNLAGLAMVNPLLTGIAVGAALVVANWDKVKETIEGVQQKVEEFKRSLEPINNWFLQLQGGGNGTLVQGQVTDLVTDYRKVKAIEKTRGEKAGQESFENFKKNFARELREAGINADAAEEAVAKIDLSWTVEQMDAYINSFTNASAAVSALKDEVDSLAGDYDINFNINTYGEMPNPGQSSSGPKRNRSVSGTASPDSMSGQHAKGLWNVPYDGYVAELHRGETVLNASRARDYRQGGSSGVDISALVSAISESIRSSMRDVTVKSYLSGRDVTDDVNRNTVRQLKARRFAT